MHESKQNQASSKTQINSLTRDELQANESFFHQEDSLLKQLSGLGTIPNASVQAQMLSRIPASQIAANPQLLLNMQQQFGNNHVSQVVQMARENTVQRFPGKTSQVRQPENKTGLPDNIKAGIENLSGYSMDDVKVHYNSDKPAQLQAHAYTQGTDIHVAPRQEEHLPHEAWHVVQQMQRRVKPTMQMKEVLINDDEGLEREADVMGQKLGKIGVKSAKDVFSQAISNSRPQKSTQQMIQLSRKGKKSKHDRKAGRLAKFLGEERSIPLEEEQPYSISFESETINPYAPAEIEEIIENNEPGSLFDVDPQRLRTMHAGISDRFSDGATIEDTVNELKQDKTAVRRLPTIKVAAVSIRQNFESESSNIQGKRDKQLMLFTEDHRRVVAARLAGITSIKAQMKAEPSVIGNYTTKNQGMSVEVRTYRRTEEGAHQRENKSTFPGSGKVLKYVDDK